MNSAYLRIISLFLVLFTCWLANGCPPGCSQCTVSQYSCDPYFCYIGWNWSTNANTCLQCGYCSRCSVNGPGNCDQYTCNLNYGFNATSLQCSPCATHCTYCTVSGPTKCDPNSCNTSYVYNSTSSSCSACGKNCSNCINNGPGQCDPGGCVSGYYFNSSTLKCLACASGCYGCLTNGPGYCDPDKCGNGTLFNNSTLQCDYCAPNCLSCEINGPGYCDYCMPTYNLTTNNQCGACSAGCNKCILNGAGFCDADWCQASYRYDFTNKVCALCATGCSWCYATAPGFCQINGCSSGHAYNANTAWCDIICAANCQGCLVNGNAKCDPGNCSTGYLFNNSTKLCNACSLGCNNCTINGTSKCDSGQCAAGYTWKASTLACSACSSNCSICDVNGGGKCDSNGCNEGSVYNSISKTCDSCLSSCASCAMSGPGGCDMNTCEHGYVYDSTSNTCQPCSGNCSSCNTNGVGKCDPTGCLSGFAYNSTKQNCVPVCSGNCSTCTINGPGLCDRTGCKSGYSYNNFTQTCFPGCPYGCYNCTMSGPGKCDPVMFCKTNSTYVANSSSCQPCSNNCSGCRSNGPGLCDPGGCFTNYTLNISSNLCVLCAPNCSVCDINGPGSCDPHFCQYGFIYNYSTKLCDSCAPSCLNCSNGGAGTCNPDGCAPSNVYNSTTLGCSSICAPNCTECATIGAFRCDPTGCLSNLYFNSTTYLCDSCAVVGCLNCSTSGGSYCNPGQCNTTLYTYNSTTRFCDPICSSHCNSCYSSGPMLCDPSGCLSGYWFNSSSKLCVKCDASCASCFGANNSKCTSCSSGFYLQSYSSSQCLTNCPSSYYENTTNNTCLTCDPSCFQCSGPTNTNCTACSTGTFLQGASDSCVTNCSVGYWGNTGTNNCTSCDASCSACWNLGNNYCSSCTSGYYLQPNSTTCSNSCPAGYWENTNNSTCALCDVSCSACFGPTSSNCKSCSSGNYLQPSPLTICNSTCPSGYIKNSTNNACSFCGSFANCSLICPSSKYFDNTTNGCRTCSSGCSACYGSAMNCSACIYPYYFIPALTECAATCPSNYYNISANMTCSPCDVSCATCFGPDGSSCYTCAISYFMQPNSTTCLQSCPIGQWQNQTTLICYNCHSYCISCFGELNTECHNCSAGYFLLPNNSTTCSNYIIEAQTVAIKSQQTSASIYFDPTAPCSTGNSVSCSKHGACVYQPQYLEKRCVCSDMQTWGGTLCNTTVSLLQQVASNDYVALEGLKTAMQNISALSNQDIQAIASVLETFSDSDLANSTVISQRIEMANLLLQGLLAQDARNFSNASSVIQSLMNTASSAISQVYERDCLLSDPASLQIYNQTFQMIKSIGNFVIENLGTQTSWTFSSGLFTLQVLSTQTQNLYNNPSSPSSIMPYVQLSASSSTNTSNDNVILLQTTWSSDILDCPNVTQYINLTNRTTFDLLTPPSLTQYQLSNSQQLLIYYPDPTNRFTSCMTGCKEDSDTQNSNTYICRCDNISEYSLSNLLLFAGFTNAGSNSSSSNQGCPANTYRVEYSNNFSCQPLNPHTAATLTAASKTAVAAKSTVAAATIVNSVVGGGLSSSTNINLGAIVWILVTFEAFSIVQYANFNLPPNAQAGMQMLSGSIYPNPFASETNNTNKYNSDYGKYSEMGVTGLFLNESGSDLVEMGVYTSIGILFGILGVILPVRFLKLKRRFVDLRDGFIISPFTFFIAHQISATQNFLLGLKTIQDNDALGIASLSAQFVWLALGIITVYLLAKSWKELDRHSSHNNVTIRSLQKNIYEEYKEKEEEHLASLFPLFAIARNLALVVIVFFGQNSPSVQVNGIFALQMSYICIFYYFYPLKKMSSNINSLGNELAILGSFLLSIVSYNGTKTSIGVSLDDLDQYFLHLIMCFVAFNMLFSVFGLLQPLRLAWKLLSKKFPRRTPRPKRNHLKIYLK